MSRSAAASRLALAAWGALAIASPLPAAAYRPFDSTDAAVAERGEMEIELGPVGLLREGGERTLVVPSLVLNWGFAKGWEAVLEGRHFVRLGSGERGEGRVRVEETGLSIKTVLRQGSLQERPGPSLALEAGALLPTINGEPGAGARATLIASQRWAPLAVHVNGAAALTRSHVLGLFGGVILEGHPAWALRPVAEIFVEWQRDLPAAVSGLAGAIWRVRENLALDAGLRLAREGGEGTAEIRAGLTWSFPVGAPR